tara:strand:- start:23533 stop:24180 length:648 start_codon:yes stop_codon:yes gene_type:complete
MTKLILLSIITFLFIGCQDISTSASLKGPKKSTNTKLQSGDIIFQSSMSGQSYAIQLATHSKYSHVGILFEKDGEMMVYEAVQPVCVSDLDEWISRGDDDHYVVKRLKNAEDKLTPKILEEMKSEATNHLGKNYDLYFGWSDERIYCSELVWKIYNRTLGIEVAKPQLLKDFDLTHPVVQKKLKERYGNNIPYDEKVISPGAMFESEVLEEIMSK